MFNARILLVNTEIIIGALDQFANGIVDGHGSWKVDDGKVTGKMLSVQRGINKDKYQIEVPHLRLVV